jgi:hypothetical protein
MRQSVRLRVTTVVAFVLVSLVAGAPAASAKGGGSQPKPPPPPAAPAGPAAPAPIAPIGGASVVQPVEMQWSASSGTRPIVAYNWQVASNSTFTALLATGSTAASTVGGAVPLSAAVSGLANGAYFWRVDAVQDATDPNVGLITGPWSAASAFTVTGSAAGTPVAPSMIGPPDLFKYHPYEFVRNEWTPVAGAAYYLLEYDNEPSFTLPLFNADYSPIHDTTAPLMFGEPVGDLWFRVRAVSADGKKSLPSNVRKVTITYNAPVPPAPLLTGPANGTSLTLPATLDWADDANPQSYELQIGTDPNFAQANRAECTGVEWCVRGIPESKWTIPNLTTGTKYWRVRSEHGDSSLTTPALSAWSAVRSFKMLQTPPRILALEIDAITDNGLTVYSHTHAYSGTGPDNRVFGRLTLDPFLPPGGTTVSLTSSNPAVASVPASVLVDRPCCLDNTAALGSFPIDPKQVTVPTTVTITATLPTGSISIPLTVDPAAVKRVDVGGTAGTVVLGGIAPAGGAAVTFTSSNPALLPAPAPLTIAAGGSSGAFTIAPKPVTTATTVTLTAKCRTSSASFDIELHPAPSLLTPAAGASVARGAAVRFSWSNEGPGGEIQVSTSPAFGTTVFDRFTYGDWEITTSTLPAGTLYWRVRAHDQNYNMGPWSGARTLTVR